MNKITSSQFMSLLNTPAPIQDYEITDLVTISFEIKILNLKDCKFHSGLIINSMVISCIEMENVEVGGNLIITGVQSPPANKNAIFLNNVTIHENLKLQEAHQIKGTLTFEAISIKKDFFSSGFSGESLIINDSRITKFILNYGGVKNIHFRKSVFGETEFNTTLGADGILTLEENEIDSLRIDLCADNTFESRNNTFHNDVEISINNLSRRISTTSDDFKGNLILMPRSNESNELELSILSSKFENDLIISPHQGSEVARLSIKKFEIEFYSETKKSIIVSDLTIENLLFKGTNFNASIYLHNIIVCNFTSSKFYNNGSLIFSRFQSTNGKLEIIDTYLGDAKLIDFDFNSFDAIIMHDCLISEIIPVSVVWPSDKKFQNLIDYNLKKQKNASNIFRQLKVAVENTQDIARQLKFKELEYKAYRLELKSKKGNCGDKVILWLSRTNDYGQNWLKPVKWIIGITLLFYIFIVISLSPNLTFSYNESVFDFNFLVFQLKEYSYLLPQMLDPLRRLSTVLSDNEQKKFLVQIFDISHRIVYGFLIYQTIKAFRKFSE